MGGLVRACAVCILSVKQPYGLALPLLVRRAHESFEGGIQTLWDKQEDCREIWGYLADSLSTSYSVKMGKGLLARLS